MEQSSQNENSNAKGCETIMAIVIEEKKKQKIHLKTMIVHE
jgi:hypothetical protein